MPKAKLTPIAQRLRREATKEENQLWYQFLRQHKLRFRRQMVLGKYVVDFYCAELQLAIEIDGSIHDHLQEADLLRTKNLETTGVIVIRYTNDQVINNLSFVLKDLHQRITSLESSLP